MKRCSKVGVLAAPLSLALIFAGALLGCGGSNEVKLEKPELTPEQEQRQEEFLQQMQETMPELPTPPPAE